MDLVKELLKPSSYERKVSSIRPIQAHDVDKARIYAVVDKEGHITSYERKVSSVKLIQTHISWVFLTGEYCYKVKKPVNFEFLDFTTLEKRKFYCNEEIRLNRRLCPEIYIGVVPITRSDEKIRVDGDGKIIDYAVKMEQLPQNRIMTRLLEKNKVGYEHIENISKALAEFHQEVATGSEINRYGSIHVIEGNWEQNFEQTRDLRGNLIQEEVFDKIENSVRKFIGRNGELLKRRIQNARIRECHGDVHSGNIFLIEHRPYIFDAIEFNPAFNCSDVAAEVAFLSMDLDFHGRRDLSEFFIKRYMELSTDVELVRLLNFYKCYRAYVRAKVTSFRLLENPPKQEKKNIEELTKRYFTLADEYCESFV